MSYDKTKTFDRADEELNRVVELNKFWGEQFKELIERVYVVMKDGKTFTIDSQDETGINLDVGVLDESLRGIKDKKYNIKEIDTIIHNHFRRPTFSSGDKKQYMRLKKYGFTGKFLIYNHMREQVYEYKPKEKK